MLFNSYIFVLLYLSLVLIGYFGLNHFKQYKPAMVFLVGMSCWFCGYQNLYYLVILLVSIAVNYLIYHFMTRIKREPKTATDARKMLLAAGILMNVGLLFVCKYYDFFIANLNVALKTNIPFLEILLPLGISFYTFAQIAFLVDAYRGECNDYSILEYTAYVTFFPKLIQGPIAYHSELISQFRDAQKKQINYANMSKGIYAFALGLAKKVLIADTLAKIVNVGYGEIGQLNSNSVMLVMISYSLQIYFDFSGYCDMALGMSRMLNIELPINFSSPYKAESISDFWDRWHMTLTRFFTKYIYIPLGGSRKGRLRTYANVMIVFLVSGFWHGANWTFVIWGVLNGLFIVVEKIVKYSEWKLPKFIKVTGAFIVTTFAWSIFRASSFGDLQLLWQQLFTGGIGPVFLSITEEIQALLEVSVLYRVGFGTIIGNYLGFFLAILIGLLLFACFFMANTQEKVQKLKLTTGKLITVVGLLFWSIMSLAEISEFLYVNF